ncbi:MAG TPA: hypothetical protein VFX86_03715 [Candidatus Saccharimonadales bacterium]|nr:hypothetical protein [Candidatus Saccharimonadales bacterium]
MSQKGKNTFIIIGIVVLSIPVYVFLSNQLQKRDNTRKEVIINQQLDSLSTYASKYLGSNFEVDNTERELTCWRAEQGPFDDGNKWCGAKVKVSTSLNDNNKQQVHESYKSIYNDLIANKWVQYWSYPQNITPNDNPPVYYVDITYREGVVCNSRISNSDERKASQMATTLSATMDCSWRAGS